MASVSPAPELVHYLPLLTTILAASFVTVLMRRYLERGSGTHLLWWAFGVFAYGLGTALESSVTLFGNSIELTKAWYVAGAILGGYPLAQGTVFLLLPKRSARVLTAISLPFIVGASVLVLISPVDVTQLEPHRPSGAILEWQWVRLLTPFINGYAAFFLIGGAILSAFRYARRTDGRNRMIGNALIAVGALLPGIGGGMAKAGIVEGLYVGEFAGLILIWCGYTFCVSRPATSTSSSPIESASSAA